MLQIGRSNQSKGNADRENLHRAADMWLHPPTNELFVADGYGNHRVVVFDAGTGAFKRMWGALRQHAGGRRPLRGGRRSSRSPATRAAAVQHRPRRARRQ